VAAEAEADGAVVDLEEAVLVVVVVAASADLAVAPAAAVVQVVDGKRLPVPSTLQYIMFAVFM
jgi:hypothetical protein